MSFKRKIKRNQRKKIIKKRIDELLEMLDCSRSSWKKENIRVEGKGLNAKIAITRFKMTDKEKWGRHIKGHKPSLIEQFSVLWDLYQSKTENEKLLLELEERIKEEKEKENVRQD